VLWQIGLLAKASSSLTSCYEVLEIYMCPGCGKQGFFFAWSLTCVVISDSGTCFVLSRFPVRHSYKQSERCTFNHARVSALLFIVHRFLMGAWTLPQPAACPICHPRLQYLAAAMSAMARVQPSSPGGGTSPVCAAIHQSMPTSP
jgi:hypothetical protein